MLSTSILQDLESFKFPSIECFMDFVFIFPLSVCFHRARRQKSRGYHFFLVLLRLIITSTKRKSIINIIVPLLYMGHYSTG